MRWSYIFEPYWEGEILFIPFLLFLRYVEFEGYNNKLNVRIAAQKTGLWTKQAWCLLHCVLLILFLRIVLFKPKRVERSYFVEKWRVTFLRYYFGSNRQWSPSSLYQATCWVSIRLKCHWDWRRLFELCPFSTYGLLFLFPSCPHTHPHTRGGASLTEKTRASSNKKGRKGEGNWMTRNLPDFLVF